MLPLEQFQKIDRIAADVATRGGAKPLATPLWAATILGIGAFVILHWFSIATEIPPEKAFVHAVGLAALVAGCAYFIVDAQWRAWFDRYERAFEAAETSLTREPSSK